MRLYSQTPYHDDAIDANADEGSFNRIVWGILRVV